VYNRAKILTIEFDDETQRLIDDEVASGRFRDAASFLASTVKHFPELRQNLDYGKDQIEAMIADAAASLDRGEGMDGDESFAQLEKEEAELRRRSA
jgi:Arc/MetJ-type ribon-helix-helix transcriptional regulator